MLTKAELREAACGERTQFTPLLLTSISPHTMHLFCVSKLPYSSVIRVCAEYVWVMCVCRPVCVKRKTPIQKNSVCVGEGGALFHTQPVGNSSPSPLVVAQFAYPAILHSLSFSRRLRSRTEILELRGNLLKLSPKLKSASRLNTDPKIRAPSCTDYVVVKPCACPSLKWNAACVCVICNLLWFAAIKIGTHLKGKPQWSGCRKATTQRVVALWGEKQQNDKKKWINKRKLWNSAEF